MKILTLSVFILDQACKYWINENIKIGEKYKLFPKLNITNVKNKGMAFGAFSGKRKLLLTFSVLSLAALWRGHSRASGCEKTGISLMVGGGISNIYDRAVKNEVTDYICFESKHITPVFNLADVFVLIGFLITIISRMSKKNLLH